MLISHHPMQSLTGHSWAQILSVSGQSSVGEVMEAWPIKAHPMDSETPGLEDQMDGRLSAGPAQRVMGYDTHPSPTF